MTTQLEINTLEPKAKNLHRAGETPNSKDIEAGGLLSIECIRSAIATRDTVSMRKIMQDAANSEDSKILAYSAERAWRMVQNYLREGEEKNAMAILSAMPGVFVDSRRGHDRDDALAISSRSHMRTASSTLIDYGANPAHRDMEQMTALMHFATHGEARLLEDSLYAMEACQPGSSAKAMEQTDAQGWMLSMHAVVGESSQTAKRTTIDVLNKFGFEFNSPQGKDGFTEIHMAAGLGDVATLKQLIQQCDASVNCVSGNNLTPAMTAAYSGEAGVVKVLHESGALLDMRRMSDGMSAAHIAAMKGHESFLWELKGCGANLQINSFESQERPADLARQSGHTALSKLINDWQPPPNPMVEQMAHKLTELLAPMRKSARSMGLGR